MNPDLSPNLLKSESSLLSNFVSFEELLDKAQSEDVIHPVPSNWQEFEGMPNQTQFIRSLRTRLFRLGYLKTQNLDGGVDDDLKNAVKRFQKESGVTVDGWVGVNSWGVLQELFAFEPSTVIENWMDKKGINPAMERAISLRLIALGFADKGMTRSRPKSNSKWLERFKKILEKLEAEEMSSDQNIKLEYLVSWLFDIDNLSCLLQRACKKKNPYLNDLNDSSSDLFRFATSLLKIEFWLLGYDKVRPDGKAMLIEPDTYEELLQIEIPGSIHYQVIKDFLKSQNHWQAELSNQQLIQRCFLCLYSMSDRDVDPQVLLQQETEGLINEIQKLQVNGNANFEKAWSEIKTLASRIWDGVKRVWRFIRSVIENFVSSIVDHAKMLARAAYELASSGLTVVRKSFEVLSNGVSFLSNTRLEGSNQFISVERDSDFDFKVFVSDSAQQNQVIDFFDYFEMQVLHFRVSIRLLKLMVRVFIDLMRLGQGPWGWWRLVRSLMKYNTLYDREDRQIIWSAISA